MTTGAFIFRLAVKNEEVESLINKLVFVALVFVLTPKVYDVVNGLYDEGSIEGMTAILLYIINGFVRMYLLVRAVILYYQLTHARKERNILIESAIINTHY